MRRVDKSRVFRGYLVLGMMWFLFILGLLAIAPAPALGAPLTLDAELVLVRDRLAAAGQATPAREKLEIRWASNPYLLSPSLRPVFFERRRLREREGLLLQAIDLREALAQLGGESPQVVGEAEGLAIRIIFGVEELGRGFRMVRPAKWNNVLVNLGLKEGGLCWQWVERLREDLRKFPMEHFQPRWAVSRLDTVREHNALVITRQGDPFERGLVIDPWRKVGKPFWVPVVGDKYHWTEYPEAL